MDHLQRHRTREGANIRVQAELFFFQLFFLSGPIIMKRKKGDNDTKRATN